MNTKDTIKAIFQAPGKISPQEIKNYLKDKTSDEERFRLENQMLDDPFAADAVEGFSEFSGDLPEFNFDDFLKKVNPAVEAPSTKVVQMPERRFTLRRIAAAVAFLVAASLGLFFWSNNDQRLYSQFHERYESDAFLSLRDDSSANIIDAGLLAGLEAYDAEKYMESVEHFERMLKKDANNSDALLYGGFAYLEVGHFDKSIEYLLKVRNLNKKEYFREATWYAALAALKNGNTKQAKELTQELLQQKGRYFEKAKMLNSKL
ncbi:MAG: tetratricopeptide (TPR) repeat protein [Saprospiraceae bacterium]|jgi:tetratricopeptide (TPR) repeat protein